jgi:hypothetical protein
VNPVPLVAELLTVVVVSVFVIGTLIRIVR